MKRYIKQSFWLLMMSLFAGCASQSRLPPSNDHLAKPDQPEAESKPVLVEEPVAALKPITEPLPSKAKEPSYTIVVNEVPVKEILFALARDSKLNVDISPSIAGSVTLNAVNQTLPEILERISRQVSMIYRVENKVLIIEPDNPVFRNYKINYVNIDRDTKGGISVTNQLASSTSATKWSAGGLNNSSTSVTSVSNNHFWDSLVKNIEEILEETDKQILINRLDSDVRLQEEFDLQSKVKDSVATLAPKENVPTLTPVPTEAKQTPSVALSENSEKRLKSYKTLFASKIIRNKEAGIVSIRATQKQHEKIAEFIDLVQKSAKRQVLIEATIVEVELKDSFQMGIDWTRLNRGNSGFVFGQTLGSKGGNFNTSTGAFSQGDANALGAASSAGLVASYINPTSALGNITASISLLEQFGNAKVLSSPKLMVINSQTAMLKVVDNLVYFVVDAVGGTTSNGVVTPPVYTSLPNTIPVGVWMSVTPQINENNMVTLDVRPTIARQSGSRRDPNPNLKDIPNFIPEIQVREMESVLQIPSGSTAVLGGLMQDEVYKNTDGVPGLSNMPLLGNLFKGKNNAAKKTELVIFLRPTVIRNTSIEGDELQNFKQYFPWQQLQNTIDEAAEAH